MRNLTHFLVLTITLLTAGSPLFAKAKDIVTTGYCGPGFFSAVTDKKDPRNGAAAVTLATKIKDECLNDEQMFCEFFDGLFLAEQVKGKIPFTNKIAEIKGWHNSPYVQVPNGPEQIKKGYNQWKWTCIVSGN